MDALHVRDLKRCNKCGGAGPFPTEIKRGRLIERAVCKSCRNASRKEFRLANLAAESARSRRYNALPSTKQRNRERERSPEYRAMRAEYRKTEGHRNSQRRYVQRMSMSPEGQQKLKARLAVTHAIESGAMVRQPCSRCGATPAEGHHPSYEPEMWLDVVWLCRRHHAEEHGR